MLQTKRAPLSATVQSSRQVGSILDNTPLVKDFNTLNVVNRYLEFSQFNEQRTKGTIEQRKCNLIPFFTRLGIKDIRDIRYSDIEGMFAIRSRELAPSTYSCLRQIVRSFFEYCDRMEIPVLDFRSIKWVKPVTKKIVPITREQMKRVLSKIPPLDQDRILIALMFETGMRISEVASLNVENIHGNTIHVRGKGVKDRIVYMTDKMCIELNEYLRHCSILEGRVFRPLHVNADSERFIDPKHVSLRKRIQRRFASEGVKMTPHHLRHGFAVEWLLSGGDLRTLQIIMGHEYITTTERYLTLTNQQIERNYGKIITNSVLT